MTLGLSCALFSASSHALTVYTAGPGAMAKQLAAGYEQQTGVKVDVFQATTGKVMARLEAEQANPRADVLISASWDTAVDLQKKAGYWLMKARMPLKCPRVLKRLIMSPKGSQP